MTQTESESTRTVERSAESKTERRRAVFLIAVVGVNLMALSGQSAWLYGQITERLPITPGWYPAAVVASVLFGLVLESIGVYLMLQAHDAMMEGYASGSLRAAAYVIAGVMAGLNYDHFSHWARALGVMFALVSLVSPFLWSVRAKAAHRTQLAARGMADPAGVKLSSNRKIWHPILSLRVTRWASWAGETDPALAVSGWERARSVERPALQGEIQIETVEAPEIESPVVLEIETGSETETVTETVTETKTVERRRSVSREQKREQVWRERLQMIESVHGDWRERVLTYGEIKAATGLTGVETLKGIYAALARERERLQING